MQKDSIKNRLRKELNRLFRSMDFVDNNFLNKEGNIDKGNFRTYFNIYQQLGVAWEFLGLQCKHWDGYRNGRGKKKVCRICGKVKDMAEFYYLIPKKGTKKIGRRLKPNSKKIFDNKQEADILNDRIDFHGALLNVDVHNPYKSSILKGGHKINITSERNVILKERDVECYIDNHLIDIRLNNRGKKIGKKMYSGFSWEIRKKDLKNFPVIFDFDKNHKLIGLSILDK